MFDILITLFAGLVVGFILAAPLGIVNLTIINLISNQRYREAFYLGAGSASLDIFYSFISLYSTSLLFKSIQSFITDNPKLIFTLELTLLFVIILVGVIKLLKFENNQIQKATIFDKLLKNLNPYLVGLLMATTHILIPSFLPGYAYISGILLKNNLVVDSIEHFLVFAFCFGIGTQAFYTIFIILSNKFSHLFVSKSKIVLSRVIGILFLIVGLILGFKIYSNIDLEKFIT